jgi:RHS repeat-associated protein
VYIFFDRGLNIVPQYSGLIQVGEADALNKLEMLPSRMPKNGYFYTYITNQAQRKVYFNNLTIVRTVGNQRAAHSYYPYGLTWSNIDSGELHNKIFQGKDFQQNEWGEHGLEVYDFHARMYDPVLGRWSVGDPTAGLRLDVSPYNFCHNNPISIIDPSGALDEWVQLGDDVFFDSRVNSEADATELYGSNATYLRNGTTYTSTTGANVELGDFGFFKSDGKTFASDDRAEEALKNERQATETRISSLSILLAGAKQIRALQLADVLTPDPSESHWGKPAALGILNLLYTFLFINSLSENPITLV